MTYHMAEQLIEPHKDLLKQPNDTQLLYKIISVENLIESVSRSYLHFNRVDSYKDDKHDGQQLPQDHPGNEASKFLKAPNFSAANYYDQSRQRTYACCFSLENSDHIWTEYGNGGQKGKVCLIFEFGKLRSVLNKTIKNGKLILGNGLFCEQLFFINYGLVEYVDWTAHQTNTKYLTNPIKYTYLKDNNKYQAEKELRISLSTIGAGQFALPNGVKIDFPTNFKLDFDFKTAIANGVICKIEHSSNCDIVSFIAEVSKIGD